MDKLDEVNTALQIIEKISSLVTPLLRKAYDCFKSYFDTGEQPLSNGKAEFEKYFDQQRCLELDRTSILRRMEYLESLKPGKTATTAQFLSDLLKDIDKLKTGISASSEKINLLTEKAIQARSNYTIKDGKFDNFIQELKRTKNNLMSDYGELQEAEDLLNILRFRLLNVDKGLYEIQEDIDELSLAFKAFKNKKDLLLNRKHRFELQRETMDDANVASELLNSFGNLKDQAIDAPKNALSQLKRECKNWKNFLLDNHDEIDESMNKLEELETKWLEQHRQLTDCVRELETYQDRLSQNSKEKDKIKKAQSLQLETEPLQSNEELGGINEQALHVAEHELAGTKTQVVKSSTCSLL